MQIYCPLCKSNNCTELGVVDLKNLIGMWEKKLKNRMIDLNIRNDIHYLKCDNCDLSFYYPFHSGSKEFYEALAGVVKLYYEEEKQEFLFALQYIKNKDTVLEVGAGSGLFGKLLGEDNKYIGLEYSDFAIQKAKSCNVNLINESIHSHAINNYEKYNIVCAFQVLEHIEDIKSFLENCINSLKKDGFLILSVPSDDSFLKHLPNVVTNFPPHHLSRWSDKALHNIGKIFNLQLISLSHDILQDRFIEDYLRSCANLIKNKVLRKDEQLIDHSFSYKLMLRILKPLFYLLKSVFDFRAMRPRGHSSTIVLKKL